MSTFEDCQTFLNFVAECFVEKPLTVDQERLQRLKTTITASQGSNEDPPLQKTNGEICKVDERRPAAASLKGSGHQNPNSHGEAYTLTNIYIYPIKSCAAYEVCAQHNTISPSLSLLFCSLSLFLILPLRCSSCRSTTGQWDRWVYYMTEAGWWWMETACAWVRRERHVYASFAHKSTCPQTNCSCRHQVRQSDSGTLKIKTPLNQTKFQSLFFFCSKFSLWNDFISVALQGWIPFLFPWKTTLKRIQAIGCVRVKFVVTGEPAMLKHLKVAAAGNTVTHIICSIFFTHINAFFQFHCCWHCVFLQWMTSCSLALSIS